VKFDHAICQTPLGVRSREENATKNATDPGNSARLVRVRTSQRGVRAPCLILCTARRIPGREGRTGPDRTARPSRRERCSGKAREEGKLQRGPPTATDHRPKLPRTTIHSPRPYPAIHSSDGSRYPLIESERSRKQKEIKKKKEKKEEMDGPSNLFPDIPYPLEPFPLHPVQHDVCMLLHGSKTHRTLTSLGR